MKLCPHESSNIDDYDTLEHTGSAECFPSMVEEGNITTTTKNVTSNTPPKESNIIEDEEAPNQESDYSSDDSSTDSNVIEQGYTKPLDISEIRTSEEIPELSEQDVLPGNAQVRTSSRNIKQITRFEENPDTYNTTLKHHQCQSYYNKKSKKKLVKAYKKEVLLPRSISDKPQIGEYPTIYFPPPINRFHTVKIMDMKALTGCKNATIKEIRNLVANGTFDKDVNPEPDEPIIDVMETDKINLDQHGNLDKLKFRMCVRGDIQNKLTPDMEDSHSPAAAFRMLRMFMGLSAQKC